MDLRAELMPPPVSGERLAELCREIDRIADLDEMLTAYEDELTRHGLPLPFPSRRPSPARGVPADGAWREVDDAAATDQG